MRILIHDEKKARSGSAKMNDSAAHQDHFGRFEPGTAVV